MATNFLNDDIYYQQREDPFELFNNRRIVAPDTKKKETNPRTLIELEKDDDVMIIDDDIKEDRALPKSNPKTETNKESATTTKTPATTSTTTTSLEEDEKMARKMQEEYDRELAEEYSRRENRIRAFNRPGSSSASRFNRNYVDSSLFPVPINEDSEDNSVLVDMSRPINSYNRSSLREHATHLRRAEPTAPAATNSSSTSRIGASIATPNNATNSATRIPPSIQDDLMNSIARSSNQANNQSNSNNNGVAATSNDASRRGYQPFDRHSAMMTGAARRSGSTNHSSAMAATASWISSLPNHSPNTNADPVNNLASAFSILNNDEIVSGFMGDMIQPNHSNHRISQFQPNNHHHNHHQHQMPANLHPSLQRRQRFAHNLNRAEFMPHSRAPASSIALRVAMNNRDFTPDDYETLLRLDEINQVKKVLSKEEIESLPSFSYKQSDAAAAASGAGSDKSCSICYEDYVSREKIMALACTHKFHKKCIQKWLQESRRCPLCQKDAVSGE